MPRSRSSFKWSSSKESTFSSQLDSISTSSAGFFSAGTLFSSSTFFVSLSLLVFDLLVLAEKGRLLAHTKPS